MPENPFHDDITPIDIEEFADLLRRHADELVRDRPDFVPEAVLRRLFSLVHHIADQVQAAGGWNQAITIPFPETGIDEQATIVLIRLLASLVPPDAAIRFPPETVH